MDSKEERLSPKRAKGGSKKNMRSQSCTVEVMDAQKRLLWEKEKLKMEKKYESQRRTVEKERKKIETERKAAEKKHNKFLKEKKDIERIKIQLTAEKEIWLNRKRKPNDAETLLGVISEKTKEWEGRREEAKVELEGIQKKRAEMKEQRSGITAEYEKLKADRLKLEEDQKEYKARSKKLVNLNEANEANKARLGDMEDILIQGEKGVESRQKEYEAKDAAMTKREVTANERDARLKKERSLMEDLKKNVYFTFEQRRSEFVKQSKELKSDMANWNSSYAELFSAMNKKVEVVN